jgi:hypothetical protein
MASLRAMLPTGVPGQYSSYAPVTVVGGVVVVVEPTAVVLVELEVVVVVGDPEVAAAITGDAFAADGGEDTIPVWALLFGYGLHVRLRSLPDTTSVRLMAGSTVRLMAPPVAVKGPTVPGVAGRTRARPVDGTGLGIGALIMMGGAATEAGVAPVASTLRLALPVMAEFPSAAAAPTIALGRTTVDW